jgi:hypothetical protein
LIPKENVVEGDVIEDVEDDIGGEEDRPSNVFLLYSYQNK